MTKEKETDARKSAEPYSSQRRKVTSSYRGVYLDTGRGAAKKKPWRATKTHASKTISIGRYET